MRHYFRMSLTDSIGLRTATVVCGASPISASKQLLRTAAQLAHAACTETQDASLAYEAFIRLCIAVSLLRKPSTEWQSTTAFCLSSRSGRPPRQRVLCCQVAQQRHEVP
jgi:hypothetical protein